jgi:hypothetical protein
VRKRGGSCGRAACPLVALDSLVRGGVEATQGLWTVRCPSSLGEGERQGNQRAFALSGQCSRFKKMVGLFGSSATRAQHMSTGSGEW